MLAPSACLFPALTPCRAVSSEWESTRLEALTWLSCLLAAFPNKVSTDGWSHRRLEFDRWLRRWRRGGEAQVQPGSAMGAAECFEVHALLTRRHRAYRRVGQLECGMLQDGSMA